MTKLKWIALSLAILTFTLATTIAISHFFDKNRMIWQSPLQITLHKPLQIVERKLLKPTIIEVVNEIPTLKDLTPIEEYICDKWGPYECKVALAVARAESGMREEAYGINTNNTIDVGIFQINTVHFKKEGCHLKDLTDQYKNVDCAYQIWEQQSWRPWVAFTSGAFKEKL